MTDAALEAVDTLRGLYTEAMERIHRVLALHRLIPPHG